MATVHDLKRSLTEISLNEIEQVIQDVRQRRRENISIKKIRSAKANSAGSKKRVAKKDKLISALSDMSEEQKQELLNQLEHGAS